jgi:signal transduction histidine kinase
MLAFLAIGLVVAAFGQIHQGLHPGIYASLVTSGDVLRLAFYALLLVGVDAERRADIRALRQAHHDLVRLHDAEVTRAALEERARLAREVHDGLAQDLWYAKLKQGRLARMSRLGDEARTLVGEVQGAIDSALSEARQAVMALRSDPQGDSFADTLQRYVEDFGDRFGLRAEFEASGDFASLGVRAQAEALRIMQEALHNVSKHADATLVRVRAVRENGEVALSVVDNGRGFDPAAVDPGRFGLVSMRERAALIGGVLTVDSAHQDGTTVTLRVPLERGTDA